MSVEGLIDTAIGGAAAIGVLGVAERASNRATRRNTSGKNAKAKRPVRRNMAAKSKRKSTTRKTVSHRTANRKPANRKTTKKRRSSSGTYLDNIKTLL